LARLPSRCSRMFSRASLSAALGPPSCMRVRCAASAGASTGLSGVVVALLFGCTLFLGPLIGSIPAQAVAPALVLVGALMLEDVRRLDVHRLDEALPPLLMILFTVCTMDLMAGLAVGCFSYTLFALVLKERRKVTPTLLLLDAVFILYLVLRNHIG